METCLSADQVPNTELIQGYLKKIQDSAEQGITFVGFVQQPSRALAFHEPEDPEEVSLSLHSSPSSVQGEKAHQNQDDKEQDNYHQVETGPEFVELVLDEGENHNGSAKDKMGGPPESSVSSTLTAIPPGNEELSEVTSNDMLTDNNNTTMGQKVTMEKQNRPASSNNGVELFALFNHPKMGKGLLKYYTVKVPLWIQHQDEGVITVEANWLDHMTQHFHSGALLVDGYFHLGNENDVSPKSVESIFIFQEGQELDSTTATAYDAIVVEQWTVIDGVGVKTDYIPLLQSLAAYGWRLTCVLPTPVVKTNSDGSLATKQIVFLQRPVLPRKKKESKKLSFKARNKSNKNSVKDAPNDKPKKSESPRVGKETERKVPDDAEDVSKGETEDMVKKNGEKVESVRLHLERDAEERKRGPGAEGGTGESREKVETEEERVETEVKLEDKEKTLGDRKGWNWAKREKIKVDGKEEEAEGEKESLAEDGTEKNLNQQFIKRDKEGGTLSSQQEGQNKDGYRTTPSEERGVGLLEQSKGDSEVVIQVSVESGLIQET